MTRDAAFWIEHLGLIQHPEGGFYKEIYRSEEIIDEKALPGRYEGLHNFGTSIYFLLEGQHFSAFHRIKSDEIWHFYEGVCINLYLLDSHGLKIQKMGVEPEMNNLRQLVIRKGTWFAAEVDNHQGFALVGCSVAPGFEFDDFELAEKQKLMNEYSQYKELIDRLCRQ